MPILASNRLAKITDFVPSWPDFSSRSLRWAGLIIRQRYKMLDAIALSVLVNRVAAVCDEMGAVLRRSAFSPNIKDRLDFSCAIFDDKGRLCAQAAHIPVHLGSMAYAMADLVGVGAREWRPGDMLIVNDPYLGGTHLPDVTLIAPIFAGNKLFAFAANRAHHADIGCPSPGSMPLATRLDQEGLVISPRLLLRRGNPDTGFMNELLAPIRNLAHGDFMAQVSANRCGVERVAALISTMGGEAFTAGLVQINDYAEELARRSLAEIPSGKYEFTDFLDDDGQCNENIPIKATVSVDHGRVEVDFSGTSPQLPGNVNCPLSVAAAAVFYVFYCLMPAHAPSCAGSFRLITIHAPQGCLVNATPPAAVAAGNVETSTRIVDVILGALAQAIPERIPAASHGSMNNLAMGGDDWTYYETIGGGMGASSRADGCDGVQTHMTNTMNTPAEVLEMTYPVRISRYGLRTASGGAGTHRGGDGLVREYVFLAPTTVTLLGERRRLAPWGSAGGAPGSKAESTFNGQRLPGKVELHADSGDKLTIKTAGGGGWGTGTT
jgi:N-methylhydantoinase B